MKPLATIFSFLINNLRPLLGPACCIYPTSCTKFAILELKEKPLHRALWAISIRVLLCNPFQRVR